MERTVKEFYETPTVTVVEVQTVGIVCESGGLENYNRNTEEDW